MRRILLTAIVLGAAALLALTAAGGEDGGDYRVRAIFDNAANLIAGEDVKIAGVKVGKVESLDVTPSAQAVAVLRIDNEGFQDFRTDAHCIIRPQSLIGEKFVDCEPTAGRAPGAAAPPELPVVPEGEPGAGQHLLPIENTSSPVDIDLINNIFRLPWAQRLSLIINELGTGLAGNGKALQETIRRAAPALRQTDEVLKLLASQNKVLERLARDSDRIMAPLAVRRREVAGFIEEASVTARAAAGQRGELERSIQKLPAALRELKPTMDQLSSLAEESLPVASGLRRAAPDITRLTVLTAPFMRQATPAVEALGEVAEPGIPALTALAPITKDLRTFAGTARPLARNLRQVTESLRDTGGIERALDYIFFQVAAINGFDSIGHYLRVGLIVNLCSTYATSPAPGCNANFVRDESASAAAAGRSEDPILARTRRVLRGASAQDVLAGGAKRRTRTRPREDGAIAMPEIALPGRLGAASGRKPAPRLAPSPQAGLLDYLFGGEE